MADETVAQTVACGSCGADNRPGDAACRVCGVTLPGQPHSIVVSVDLRPGTLFHGRYEILGPLGKGGMGMVYRARDRTLDEVVAIKILRPDLTQDPAMAQRFKGEIKMARRVRHRNVCTIHDYGESQGLLYISMELVGGVDLKHVLRDRGALDPHRGYDVAIQIAEGLQAVHDAGIVHRDLKTPNVMLDEGGVARLMDFGVAKKLAEGTVTATGHIVGTPEYMSPEQAQGKKVDFRSDVYALGIVIYEIFTGDVPFRGETPISTILKQIHDTPPLDPPQGTNLPPGVRAVLQRCLAKEPDDRYPTAQDVAEALRRARDPARRQQPMATEGLVAPTLSRARPHTPVLRPMYAWLLVVPLAAGALAWMSLRSPAGGGAPPVTVAAAVPTTLPPAAPPATVAPPADGADVPPAVAVVAAPTTMPAVAARPATPPPAAVRRTTPSAPPVVAASVAPAAVQERPAPPATQAAPGWLQVIVRPWGEVTVDGRLVGTTPFDRVMLAAGTHTVRVRHPSYPVREQTVTIRPNETARVRVDFSSPAS